MNGLSLLIGFFAVALAIFIVLLIFIPAIRDEEIQDLRPNRWLARLPSKLNEIVGIYLLVIGAIMLTMWIGWMLREGAHAEARAPGVFLHIGLMLASSCIFIVAGLSQVQSWKSKHLLFYVSIGLSSFSIFLALLQFGNTGHPFLMNILAIAINTVINYFVALAYTFIQFVFCFETTK